MRISDWSSDVCSSDLERRAVREAEAVEAGAIIFDEAADDALGAQHLGRGQHQVGRGDAFLQLAGEFEADDFGDQHADRLAEHRGLRLDPADAPARSEEHTSELQSLMRISYAVFCLKKKTKNMNTCNLA